MSMRLLLQVWFIAALSVTAATRAESFLASEQPPPAGLSFADALQLAEQQAPSLSAQSARLRAAESSAGPAAALPDPQLVVGAENVPVSGADRGSFSRDFMTMQKIGLMQDVPNADKRQARADVAAAAIASAAAQQEVERLKVRQQTAMAWLNRFHLERSLAVLDELERENRLLAAAVQAQWRSGGGDGADVVMPAQEAAELADRRDELARDIAAAKAVLKRWIGDDAYLPLTSAGPTLALDPSQLHRHIHHHPEVAAFGPMADRAAAELREAEADKKPDWGVELDYQRRAAPFSDMVSLEFRMGLPLFSGSRQGPRIEAKRHVLDEVDAQRQALYREHAAELDSDLAQYTALQEQRHRLQQTRLFLAQQKVDLQMAGYRAGQVDLAAVLTARRELIEMRLRSIELERQQAVLTAKLYFAYGETAL